MRFQSVHCWTAKGVRGRSQHLDVAEGRWGNQTLQNSSDALLTIKVIRMFFLIIKHFPASYESNFCPKWFYEQSDGIWDQPPINNAGGNRSGTLVFHWGIVLSSGPERSDLFFLFFCTCKNPGGLFKLGLRSFAWRIASSGAFQWPLRDLTAPHGLARVWWRVYCSGHAAARLSESRAY